MTDSKYSDKWDDVIAATSGHVFVDEFREGVRFLVMRGPSALCAYVGVPVDHPLAGKNYDDIPVECHGGLTFAGEGKKQWPEGWYWYGWDYAHAGDYATYYDQKPLAGLHGHGGDKKWTVKGVVEDAWWTVRSFQQLANLVASTASTTA